VLVCGVHASFDVTGFSIYLVFMASSARLVNADVRPYGGRRNLVDASTQVC
jgi:hypothetical protein